MCVRSDPVEDSAAADPASGAPPPAQCRLLGEPDAVTGVSNASAEPVAKTCAAGFATSTWGTVRRRVLRVTPGWSPGEVSSQVRPGSII